MTTARDIMTPDARCVSEHASLVEMAKQMRELGVGALPICSPKAITGHATDAVD